MAVEVAVFDVSGRRMATLERGVQPAGVHHTAWEASQAPTGIFFCALRAGGTEIVRRMIRVR